MALVVFVTALIRFSPGGLLGNVVAIVACVIGAALSVIRSYRQLNAGKLMVLRELEERLAYGFFTREWELLGEGADRARYWRLTEVEALLPWMFFLVFCGTAVAALCLNGG